MSKELVNDSKSVTTTGIPRRHGWFDWHGEECVLEDMKEHGKGWNCNRSRWCRTHGQWTTEIPVKVTIHWGDGTVTEQM